MVKFNYCFWQEKERFKLPKKKSIKEKEKKIISEYKYDATYAHLTTTDVY